ncbi:MULTISPECIES: hypothetical protein [unclassified Methylobacterium]|uniref:hypothetical protein n=1 Tax=unclassified Methylobacterium TaxID=2615210 RepID=UPI001FBA96B0|nr:MULTISPECIES: hypothetical protein [unclassified Methylobacterium]MCJ2019000.1 hypothetical protein [Methylobacterium sp. E-065]
MADPNGQQLSDEELDRLARKLFAEVRAESPEAKAGRALESAGAIAGAVIPVLPDWLLSDDGAAKASERAD